LLDGPERPVAENPLEKDVGIARGSLAEVGVEGPMLQLGGRLLSAARAELGQDADDLEAIKLIKRQAGAQIRG
jgi:hypothetical protein